MSFLVVSVINRIICFFKRSLSFSGFALFYIDILAYIYLHTININAFNMDFSAFVCYDYVVYKGWSWCSHMINISGHLREERKITGYYDQDVPLIVNCCGKQVFQTQDYFCNRKNGRLDYQIIYIHRRKWAFLFDNEWLPYRQEILFYIVPDTSVLFLLCKGKTWDLLDTFYW